MDILRFVLATSLITLVMVSAPGHAWFLFKPTPMVIKGKTIDVADPTESGLAAAAIQDAPQDTASQNDVAPQDAASKTSTDDAQDDVQDDGAASDSKSESDAEAKPTTITHIMVNNMVSLVRAVKPDLIPALMQAVLADPKLREQAVEAFLRSKRDTSRVDQSPFALNMTESAIPTDHDSQFEMLARIDTEDCIKRMVCRIGRDPSVLGPFGRTLQSLFKDLKATSEHERTFKQAFDEGAKNVDKDRFCSKRWINCQHPDEILSNMFKSHAV